MIDNKLNNFIRACGIENTMYGDGEFGSGLYDPLISMVKEYECLFEYNNVNVLYLYKKFNQFLDIGCTPFHSDKTCAWYSSGSFVNGIISYVNFRYKYTLKEIRKTSMNIMLRYNEPMENYKIISRRKNMAILRLVFHIVNTFRNMGYIKPIKKTILILEKQFRTAKWY